MIEEEDDMRKINIQFLDTEFTLNFDINIKSDHVISKFIDFVISAFVTKFKKNDFSQEEYKTLSPEQKFVLRRHYSRAIQILKLNN
jgi:hypothetical protein